MKAEPRPQLIPSGSALKALCLWGILLLMALPLSAQVSLHVFYTGEIFGTIKSQNPRDQGDILRVKQAIQEYMDENGIFPSDVLIFDTGRALAFDYLSRMDSGRMVVKLMKEAGYSAITPSDMDFRYGLENVEEIMAKNPELVFLGGNVRKDSAVFLQPAHVFRRKGIRIGVVGVINDLTSTTITETNGESLSVQPALAVASRVVDSMQKICDLVIALNHTSMGENLTLSQRVPDLKILIANPSEDSLDILRTYGASGNQRSLLVKAPSNARNIGHLEIIFDRSGRRLNVERVVIRDPIPVATRDYDGIDMAPYDTLRNIFREYIRANFDSLGPSKVLAYLEASERRYLIDYALQTMLQSTSSEVAILNEGAFLFGALNKADSSLTLRDIYAVTRPYDFLVTLRLTGKQIKDILKRSVNWPVGSPQRLRMMSINNYKPVPTREPKVHGQAFVDDEVYAVVTNAFLANGGDGYETFLKGTYRRDKFQGENRLRAGGKKEKNYVFTGAEMVRYLARDTLEDFTRLHDFLKNTPYLNQALWMLRFENLNLGFKSVQVSNNQGFANANDQRVDSTTQNTLNISTSGFLALLRRDLSSRWENSINFRYGFERVDTTIQESDDRIEFQSQIDLDAFRIFKSRRLINAFGSIRFDTEFTPNIGADDSPTPRRQDFYVFAGFSHLGKENREYRAALFTKTSFATGRNNAGTELNIKFFKTFKNVRFGSFFRYRHVIWLQDPQLGSERYSIDANVYIDLRVFQYLNIKPQVGLFVWRDAVLKRTATNLQLSLNLSYTTVWKPRYIRLGRKR